MISHSIRSPLELAERISDDAMVAWDGAASESHPDEWLDPEGCHLYELVPRDDGGTGWILFVNALMDERCEVFYTWAPGQPRWVRTTAPMNPGTLSTYRRIFDRKAAIAAERKGNG